MIISYPWPRLMVPMYHTFWRDSSTWCYLHLSWLYIRDCACATLSRLTRFVYGYIWQSHALTLKTTWSFERLNAWKLEHYQSRDRNFWLIFSFSENDVYLIRTRRAQLSSGLSSNFNIDALLPACCQVISYQKLAKVLPQIQTGIMRCWAVRTSMVFTRPFTIS